MKLFKRFKAMIRETDTGQAMVEFVLCATVLIPILLYSMYFFDLVNIKLLVAD